MNTYHIYFLGRRSGAIGAYYPCRVIINAASASGAMKQFRANSAALGYEYGPGYCFASYRGNGQTFGEYMLRVLNANNFNDSLRWHALCRKIESHTTKRPGSLVTLVGNGKYQVVTA